MPFTYLDLAVAGIVVLSGLLAMVRGFTREVLSIAAWGIAAVAALLLHPRVVPYVKEHIANDTIALVAAIAGIFLLTLVIVSFITVRISDFVLDSQIGAVDRTLGFAFGLARGALICVIAFLFLDFMVPEKTQPDWVRDARSRPLLQTAGAQLRSVLPDDPGTLINRVRPGSTPGSAPNDAPPATVPPATVPPARQGWLPVPPVRSPLPGAPALSRPA